MPGDGLDPATATHWDYNWVHWALFDGLAVNFEDDDLSGVTIENYRNTNGVRVGLDWAATAKLALRGGFIYHTAAAPPETVTPLLPEGERNEFTFGFGSPSARPSRSTRRTST